MKNSLRSMFLKVTPKQRQVLVISGAAALLLVTIALFQGEPEKKAYYNKRQDQVTNVLTDQSNRNVGLDRMAGQIRRLDAKNKELNRDLEKLKVAQKGTLKHAQIKEMEDELNELRKELKALKTLKSNTTPTVAMAGNGAYATGTANNNATPNGNSINTVGNPFGNNEDTTKGRKKTKPIKINVVSEHEESKETTAPEAKEDVAYIPAGSIITGTILSGADFPTSRGSFENPTPTLIRIQKEAILPNKFRSDIRECFLLVGGRGELASERAKLRGEKLSCVRQDGAIIETKLSSYVVGEDGKEGIKGRLVTKQGQMIARSMVAGFASGMSEAFDFDPVPVIATNPTGNTQYQQNFSNDAVKGGFAKGAAKSLDRVAQFYMDLAEEMFPVIEVNAGRQVDVVVINGTDLTITSKAHKKDI